MPIGTNASGIGTEKWDEQVFRIGERLLPMKNSSQHLIAEVSRRRSKVGVWFFTTNSDFWSRNIYYSATRSQTQAPIGSFEGHLSYDFKPRLWASLDGNFWFGGKQA